MELRHKLERIIDERGVTITAICKALEMPESTFRSKMQKPQRWRVDEFIRFCNFLRLTEEETRELGEFFLTQRVGN